MTPIIEELQKQIGINLINVAPVPWDKIGFHATCDDGYCTIYYFFIESETGVISSVNNADVRFKKEWYKVELSKTKNNLMDLSLSLFEEYKKINPKNKMWQAFSFILNKDYNFNIDFEYKNSNEGLLNRKQWCLKYFNETAFYYYKGLYPDTTDFIK